MDQQYFNMKPNQITMSEWREAIEAISTAAPPNGSKSCREIAAELGLGITSSKYYLRKLVKAGKAKRLMCRVSTDSGVRIIPHYVLCK